MLKAEQNERITRVGPGTPMGDLMRRYWHPIAAKQEIAEKWTKAIRILGEDLVLFRDRQGELGLIDRVCPHRRVDLVNCSVPENGALRCAYHGWAFDFTGQCIEQPFEEVANPDADFKSRVKIAGYPVQEMGGLVWAYLGPLPAPLLPRWEPLVVDNAVRDICFTNLACNWLQCQENSLDPVHVEWMHRYFGDWVNQQKYGNFDMSGGVNNVQHHQKIGFDEFEYGIIKRRVLEGYTEEDDDWKHGHPVLFPNILVVGNDYQVTMQFRVPVDDENTLHISVYTWRAAPGKTAPVQATPPYRFVKIIDEQGEWIRDKVFNQDYMAWETQGPIAKRHLERLGTSDMGVIMFRQQIEREIQKVESGQDPMNVFRDPARNECLVVPLEHVKFGAAAPPPKYTPGEDGYSRDAELIEAVLDTWRVPELAVAR
ncbi:MAG TPA: aromatic ring-hydroxylating dioxygenase subunit alpha [Chloroflexota bacterium]|jgi:5,5'-dehydrodivanillate O-demethylase|nr:aromatic ring-hydroxylating dioxygenase subunit alpha [Chloroflexota bacterium]